MKTIVVTDASFKKPSHATIAILAGETAKREKVTAISSVHAELLSIKLAFEYLKEKEISNALIINDNKAIVDHLNNKAKIQDELKNIALEVKELKKLTKSRIEWRSRKETKIADIVCGLPTKGHKTNEFKTLSLPKLDNLNPTLESTALKLMEETGELAQIIGKFRGLSGERETKNEKVIIEAIARELLDVAQTAVTMMFVLEEEYGVSIDIALKQHINKLRQKKYMS